ncbi:hypothetical protein AB1N83_010357 [Pleurotus pulmonarius]
MILLSYQYPISSLNYINVAVRMDLFLVTSSHLRGTNFAKFIITLLDAVIAPTLCRPREPSYQEIQVQGNISKLRSVRRNDVLSFGEDLARLPVSHLTSKDGASPPCIKIPEIRIKGSRSQEVPQRIQANHGTYFPSHLDIKGTYSAPPGFLSSSVPHAHRVSVTIALGLTFDNDDAGCCVVLIESGSSYLAFGSRNILMRVVLSKPYIKNTRIFNSHMMLWHESAIYTTTKGDSQIFILSYRSSSSPNDSAVIFKNYAYPNRLHITHIPHGAPTTRKV